MPENACATYGHEPCIKKWGDIFMKMHRLLLTVFLCFAAGCVPSGNSIQSSVGTGEDLAVLTPQAQYGCPPGWSGTGTAADPCNGGTEYENIPLAIYDDTGNFLSVPEPFCFSNCTTISFSLSGLQAIAQDNFIIWPAIWAGVAIPQGMQSFLDAMQSPVATSSANQSSGDSTCSPVITCKSLCGAWKNYQSPTDPNFWSNLHTCCKYGFPGNTNSGFGTCFCQYDIAGQGCGGAKAFGIVNTFSPGSSISGLNGWIYMNNSKQSLWCPVASPTAAAEGLGCVKNQTSLDQFKAGLQGIVDGTIETAQHEGVAGIIEGILVGLAE